MKSKNMETSLSPVPTRSLESQRSTTRRSRNQIPGLDLASKETFVRPPFSATKEASLDRPDVTPGQAEARNPKIEDIPHRVEEEDEKRRNGILWFFEPL